MVGKVLKDRQYNFLVNPEDNLKNIKKVTKIVGRAIGKQYEKEIRNHFFSSLKHSVPSNMQAKLWSDYKKRGKYKYKIYVKGKRNVVLKVGCWLSFAQIPAIFIKNKLLDTLNKSPLHRTLGRPSIIGENKPWGAYFLGCIGKTREKHILYRDLTGGQQNISVVKRKFDRKTNKFFDEKFSNRLKLIYSKTVRYYLDQYRKL